MLGDLWINIFSLLLILFVAIFLARRPLYELTGNYPTAIPGLPRIPGVAAQDLFFQNRPRPEVMAKLKELCPEGAKAGLIHYNILFLSAVMVLNADLAKVVFANDGRSLAA